MEEIFKVIDPALLILVPVLYFFGMGISKSGIKNKYIPLLLGALGIILSALYSLPGLLQKTVGFGPWIFTAVTQGILTAGASVYFNQIKKQASKEE